ncbi:Ig-like domain-containing protein [Pyxidicoccus sp. 3LFB2]
MRTKSKAKQLQVVATLLLLMAVSACGDSDPQDLEDAGSRADAGSTTDAGNTTDAGSTTDAGTATTPTLLSHAPLAAATGVPFNESVSATFSEEMDRATLTPTTFTLTAGVAATPVQGTVHYANAKAVFWPAAHLASNTVFTATVTSGARTPPALRSPRRAAGASPPAAPGWRGRP